jgi:hypothetical protein
LISDDRYSAASTFALVGYSRTTFWYRTAASSSRPSPYRLSAAQYQAFALKGDDG